jgi:N6-L-threonylcarbamoyladenine synthase
VEAFYISTSVWYISNTTMKILGIETSCDETAAAVVEDGTSILSNIVASQVDIHARYGGIVPEVASRQHILAIEPITRRAMNEAKVDFAELSAISVTVGPGLAGSLLVGVNMAKAVALVRGLPLIGINHLEAHIYTNWLIEGEPPVFPLICLIVSGGHTDIVLMEDHGKYSLLGKTRDDAAGEAFDKVARTLGLGYPGGPAIEKAALDGNGAAFPLPRAWLKGTDDFSFSGLKTAVLHLVEGRGGIEVQDKQTIADIAASFQASVADVLVTKTIEAAKKHKARQILLAGGVAANKLLRDTMASRSPIPTRVPSPELCTDNAAMTAACGYFHFQAGHTDDWALDVVPSLRIG